MNKSLITSVSPKECELIASGKQTMLVRKTRPKIETPFKSYIYMTATKERCRLWEYMTAYINNKGEMLNGSQKVIGEFVCDRIICCQAYYDDSGEKHLTNLFGVDTSKICLSESEIFDYIIGKDKKDGMGWLWHVTELKIYDKPKELGEFRKPCVDVYQYCKGCRYGNVIISPDEEEYAMYHGGNYETFDTICCNHITRPPRSWCYVEES